MKDPFNPEKYWICSRRSCGWRGPFKDELRIPDDGGHRLVCPQCWCDSFYEEKPLFVPLRREHFDDFFLGIKHEEYRPYGDRWNEKTCHVGREVVLSLGYGKANRLKGVIVSFRREPCPSILRGWLSCYGSKHDAAACIGIKLNEVHQ